MKQLVVGKFCNTGVRRFHFNKYELFHDFFFNAGSCYIDSLTLSYIKQQFEKTTSKIKHQAQRPRERQMFLVVSL